MKAIDIVVEETVVAMIGKNPRHYLSTHRGKIQANLLRFKGVKVCKKTISRCLKRLALAGRLSVLCVPIHGSTGQWVGKHLIIRATSSLYATGRAVFRALSRFLGYTEGTRVSFDPIPLREGIEKTLLTASKIEEFCRKHRLKEGLPTSPEAFFGFARNL